MAMKFQRLDVWKRSAALTCEVYIALKTLSDMGFRQQITRSCLSMPSNIAEGWERSSDKERCRYLDIAKGSAAEFITQVYIGRKIGYIPQEAGKYWIQETEEIAAMLAALKQSLKVN
jgi:four helix bundle protein